MSGFMCMWSGCDLALSGRVNFAPGAVAGACPGPHVHAKYAPARPRPCFRPIHRNFLRPEKDLIHCTYKYCMRARAGNHGMPWGGEGDVLKKVNNLPLALSPVVILPAPVIITDCNACCRLGRAKSSLAGSSPRPLSTHLPDTTTMSAMRPNTGHYHFKATTGSAASVASKLDCFLGQWLVELSIPLSTTALIP